MGKFFNTAGPNKPDIHYTLSPMQRVNWLEFSSLMAAQKYFILHAPRQTGKTSLLLDLMHQINAQGQYRALYVNIEAAQAARNDVASGIATIVSAMARAADIYWKDPSWSALAQQEITQATTQGKDSLTSVLQRWSLASDKPLILFFDEVDALVGDTLISVLRQIRAGYAQRPEAFPQSMVLCGVRDVRDYRIHRSDGEIITGGSAFTLKSESIRLGDFTQVDVQALLQQHTDASGQTFEPGVLEEIWADNGGGRIPREYGQGRGRTDPFLQWPLTTQGYTGPMTATPSTRGETRFTGKNTAMASGPSACGACELPSPKRHS